MLSTLLLVCFNILILFTQCIPVTNTAHISENMILRLKGKNRNHTKSATLRELVDEELRLDDIPEYSSDATNVRVKRQSKRSGRRPQEEDRWSSINRKRHARRKNKHEQKPKLYTSSENTEQKMALENEAFNITSNNNNTTMKEQVEIRTVPLNQARTEWSLDACEQKRQGLLGDGPYPLCTICTAKTTFPEGTIPNEIHETICLPSGDNVVRGDTTEKCLNDFGQCKQRTKRIELRRLKNGPRPTHAYESEIEHDEWEYDYYEWRYSCDCQVTPGTVMYNHVR